jgi:Domain of unknown function (DUF6457)
MADDEERRGPIGVSADWVADLQHELGIDLSLDVMDLLELARVAAHEVARPAAPLTTFLVGYAAGAKGGGVAAVQEAADATRRLLAQRDPQRSEDSGEAPPRHEP